MSSISDSGDASADDASKADELPVFRRLPPFLITMRACAARIFRWQRIRGKDATSVSEEEQAKRRKKRRYYGVFQGLKFFDLSEKRKQRERERLREELKDVIAEQAEIDEYEIKTEPFAYRTRQSSLSPHTPPGRPELEEAPLQDTLPDVSLPGTSMNGTVCDDRPRKAMRVVYRYIVSSSSDDEASAPSQKRAPLLRPRGSPPSVDAAGVGAGGWDTSDTDGGGRPSATLAEVPTSARTLSFNDPDKGFQESRASAEAAPSTSLKKPILRKKWRERLQRERSMYRSWSDRRSSSAESSSSQEGGEGRPPLAAPRRRASGDTGLTPLSTIYKRLSSRAGNSPATSHHEGGDAEHVPAQHTTPASRQREGVRRLSSLSSGSGLREVAHPSSGGSAFSVWHSTPVLGRPRTAASPTGSDGVQGSSRQMFAAGVDRLLDENQRRRALDRGDIRVEVSITTPGRQASGAGAAHGTGQSDTAQQGTADSQRRRRTRGSLQRGRPRAESGAASSDSSRLSTAHRSIVVRIGQGWSRERVLVSNAPSVTSAIASFCEQPPQAQLLSASGAPYHMEPEDMLSQLLKLCGQEKPVTFDEALRLGQGKRPPSVVRKLGEGSAGEVYLVRRGADERVLKVIPVGGDQIVDGLKPQSLVGASAEVAIARVLSNLRFNTTNRTANFIAMNGAHCVQGPYHPVLLASWKEYEERFCSENENPEVFGDAQLFLILDFEYGGKPLEKFKGQKRNTRKAEGRRPSRCCSRISLSTRSSSEDRAATSTTYTGS
ncbi:uncharacterized protein LOC144162522 isoform X4 [Haemaphysalis longicornis]